MEVKFENETVRPPSNARMSYEDATKHYNTKCSEAFAVLGMGKRVKITDFEVNLPIVFQRVRKATEVMIKKEARKINMEMVV